MAAALVGFILAIVARYAEYRHDQLEPPILSPIYSNAVALFVPSSETPDLVPTLRAVRYYDFYEPSAALFTFMAGLTISALASFYAFMLMFKGYDLPAMVTLALSWAGCMIWDIGFGIALAIVFLAASIYIRFRSAHTH